MTKIAIIGAGAAGSYIGAFLTREGEDITLIDQWPEHVEKIKKDGLRASGSQGDFTVPIKALHLTEGQALPEPFDIAFIAVKSYDTQWAAHFIAPYLKPSGCVVSSQNCMNDELIASIVGYHREVPCVMSHIEVALWEPGHVTRGGPVGRDSGHDVFRVGETSGRVTPRVEHLVKMLSCIDGAKVTTNIWGERWAKLAQNCMGNPVGGISGLGSEGMAQNPQARSLRIHLARGDGAGGPGPQLQRGDRGRHRRRYLGQGGPGGRVRGDRRQPPAQAGEGRLVRLHVPGRPKGPPVRDRPDERLRGGQGPGGGSAHTRHRRRRLRHAPGWTPPGSNQTPPT